MSRRISTVPAAAGDAVANRSRSGAIRIMRGVVVCLGIVLSREASGIIFPPPYDLVSLVLFKLSGD